MQQLIDKQRVFFNTYVTRNISFRKEQLNKLEQVLKSNETLLYEAIYKDFKKSEFDTYTTELALVYHDIKDAKRNLKHWARIKRTGTNLLNFPAKSYIIPEPLGVSLVIGAWNYPYLLSLAPVIAAIAAGCTVILKPSELPQHTSAVMARLISENFNEDYFKVVEGGITETTQLLEQKFDKIFFTGSPAVGKVVYKAAAENLIPVTLELGGKSPAIIAADCNLKMTVKRLVWAKFLNAGQTCISPDYVLVHKSIEEKFLQLCKEEIERSDFNFNNENYVQIINDRNFDRIKALIDPDKVYYGGKTNSELREIRPTILNNITFSDAVMQEEIFGPILPVISYDDLEDAIQKVNGLEKPLSCYVFTSNTKTRKRVLNNVSFGCGGVNEAIMQISNSKLPFGGVGHSGMGAYHGEEGFKAFSHFKSIIDKPTYFELNLKYHPHSKAKMWWIRQFFRF